MEQLSILADGDDGDTATDADAARAEADVACFCGYLSTELSNRSRLTFPTIDDDDDGDEAPAPSSCFRWFDAMA